tara:strand:- start:153 stop:686 length:534 start_codon:yes stop_codon:yes gene_type:complete
MSLYLTEMVKNNYNKHNLPNLKNIISLYIGTVSEQISNYITLSKLVASSNIIIKQESDSSSSSEQLSDNWNDENEDNYSDSQSITSTDNTQYNSINKNELDEVESHSSENSDIEDITEEVLHNRILNRDIVDLTKNDMEISSSDSDTHNSKSSQSSVNSEIMNELLDKEDIETKKNN